MREKVSEGFVQLVKIIQVEEAGEMKVRTREWVSLVKVTKTVMRELPVTDTSDRQPCQSHIQP